MLLRQKKTLALTHTNMFKIRMAFVADIIAHKYHFMSACSLPFVVDIIPRKYTLLGNDICYGLAVPHKCQLKSARRMSFAADVCPTQKHIGVCCG
jgi:hypothetical protein